MLRAEDLLAGGAVLHAVTLPERLLPGRAEAERAVQLRALTVRDLKLISRASRDNEELAAALMLRQALVEPSLTLEQVHALPAGLMQILLREINRVSGITATEEEVLQALQDPLARASVLLSRELGWTPDEIGRLTMGEVMLHVAALRGGA
ncbi:hypothetical protein BKE38_02750 [Pseudoroseomonas deserti]|uniref:Uncharacterized protein n=1 Tax=Teichococcus deserti TaxID=1817963 RepID=A0A1V2H7R1_9PROT|nr:hypothetical protein [Pseudoroseomonas deserti]ONG58578.1 hypothetical protein BKE38_02750 [Pseudoroseomonas deserti]